jgi:hypothetical protein
MKRAGLWLVVPLLLAVLVKPAFAGPPFQTDDPAPVPFGHYEFYVFGAMDGTPVEVDSVGPAVEFNWGAVPNLQIHVILPFGAAFPRNNPAYYPTGFGPSAYGLTDMELGVKYRFVKETKWRPMIGTFTMVELPTGSAARGLGVGSTWYRLPLWLQKDWGHWTTYGGGGYQVVDQGQQYLATPFGGWLLQRDIGKKLTLGAEVYSHGAQGLGPGQTEGSTMVDVGGYYYFRNPGFQLLFAYGHTVAGQAENYGYLGLYWTWGSKPGKGLNGFLHRHL